MPRNAHDASRLAGGSSTGSAVAVALGVVPVAVGTDGGGSIRIPAAYNGIFVEGIKLNVAGANSGAFLVDDADGLVLTEGEDGSYALSVNVPRPTDVHTVAYVTVSAALASFKDARNGGRSVQVSLTGDDDDFHDALVVTFDSVSDANWGRTQTIHVRAVDDAAANFT